MSNPDVTHDGKKSDGHCLVLTRSTYINRTVVLIDLDAKVVADRGEVVWLGHVAQSVVLRMDIMTW